MSVGLRADAKVTWTLEVTGVRDGLHELRSEMTTVGLSDTLVVEEGGNYVRVLNPFADPVPEGEGNIVARALAVAGRRAGVVIEKSIPPGGGLGGGSADAAAILRWAGVDDPARALSLGSDVPFCVVGGRALVEGVGERVTPLPFVERRLTLVTPGFAVSTADVYRAYDEMRAGGWRPGGENHLEEPAALVEPRLGRAMAWLRERHDDVRLAGSGSTMVVGGHPREDRWWVEDGPDGPLRFLRDEASPSMGG
ncbi:MAG TPA: 4-(cytidine 5'-diphospho)-2-C-methyl-D-erythritol kinase [Acidimicrobiales bacterium]|nr:4-(cytidine 5'-diphospho)-2-C-methyl-D-erythritol kinase [Acidimicrobiales bacterium]